MSISIKEKGEAGEKAFKEWLDREGLGYLYINQDPSTYAALFRSDIKRPDFFVLLESIGLLAVDVKNYTLSGGEYTLNFKEEVRKVLSFERIFRIPVWYAYMDEESQIWYWLSALKAVVVGDRRTNSQTNEEFLAIKIEEFESIETNSDLGKLYTHRMPSIENLTSDDLS